MCRDVPRKSPVSWDTYYTGTGGTYMYAGTYQGIPGYLVHWDWLYVYCYIEAEFEISIVF